MKKPCVVVKAGSQGLNGYRASAVADTFPVAMTAVLHDVSVPAATPAQQPVSRQRTGPESGQHEQTDTPPDV